MQAPHRRTALLTLALFAAFIAVAQACTLQNNSTPALDRSANFTQAAQTLDAQLTLAAAGAFPTATPLSTLAGTTIAVITPASAGDPGQPSTPDPGASCDHGAFVEDVTIPDGTVFEPGETFVKTWRILNDGSCTWTLEYSVIFESGDAMGGPASFPLAQSNVPPGSEVEISINLSAPEAAGSYRGDWLLRNPAGQSFGLGSQGTATFWVAITVQETSDAAVSFDNVHDCDGTPTAIFRIENQGGNVFDSVEIEFTNLETGVVIFGPFASNGPFMGSDSECPPGGDSLGAGEEGFLGGGLGAGSSSGDNIEASFTICNQEDLGGICIETTVEFNIP